MASTPPSPIALGTVIADRFVVERVLGSGGMSTVVAAEDLRLRWPVAIKILRPEFAADSAIATRFLREARAVVRLRNEHVVTVIDAGTTKSKLPYLVMEFLDGRSLAELLQESGPFEVEEALDYVLQTLEALSEAHRANIVHRDLKPDNLMLIRREDDSPLIKVIDFGISKLEGPEITALNLTRNEFFLGSPLYSSPEQFNDAKCVDRRTDIWSIGVVLYELLTGRLPFEANSLVGLASAITKSEPRPLRKLRPELPDALEAIVARCMRKDPADRFQTVQELARVLSPLTQAMHCQISVERIIRVQSTPPAAPAHSSSTPPSSLTLGSLPHVAREPSARSPSHTRWALALTATAVAILFGISALRRHAAAHADAGPAAPLAAARATAEKTLAAVAPDNDIHALGAPARRVVDSRGDASKPVANAAPSGALSRSRGSNAVRTTAADRDDPALSAEAPALSAHAATRNDDKLTTTLAPLLTRPLDSANPFGKATRPKP